MNADGDETVLLWRRLAALFYDALLVLALLYGATIVAIWFNDGAVPAETFWFQAWLFAVAWFYFAFSWTRGGQTLGMRAWRCRLVVAGSGGHIGWGRALARFPLAVLSLAAFGLGFWWSLADRERRAWHDRWSGTRMILIPS